MVSNYLIYTIYLGTRKGMKIRPILDQRNPSLLVNVFSQYSSEAMN